jgi:tRNA threonylcarbamoyladenosine biosynthesis protein TsaE
MKIQIHTLDDLFQYIRTVQQYPLILLEWDLGAGKTTFTQYLAQAHGIVADQVTSPTYSYLQVYDDRMLHIDMYRLEDPVQLTQLGILDTIDTYPLVVIERPKWLDHYISHPYLHIHIIKNPDESRILHVLHS